MTFNDNPYFPIAMSLKVAIDRRDFAHNPNICVIVREAQKLQTHEITIRSLTRSVYTYTTAINRYNPRLVNGMHPDNLSESDFRKLLEFFDNL